MDNFYFIGVDVSKKKLDFCVLFEGKVLREEQVSNHQQAVARLIGELKNDLEMEDVYKRQEYDEKDDSEKCGDERRRIGENPVSAVADEGVP